MKFFTNSLHVHDFFTFLKNGSVKETYNVKVWPLIRDDFDLSKRISRPDTIINKINKMSNPQQFIMEKMTHDHNTSKVVEDIPDMDLKELMIEINREGLIGTSTDDEQLRDRLRKHYANTLAWEEYTTSQLKKELQQRDIKVPTRYNYTSTRRDKKIFSEIACRILDMYEKGNLTSINFRDEESYDTYVSGWLKDYKLSTSGNKTQKRERYLQHILKEWQCNINGAEKELEERVYRYMSGNAITSDLSDVGIIEQLKKRSLRLDGNREEMQARLVRCKLNKNVYIDYTTDRLREILTKNKLSTSGNRIDLLTRLQIVRLKRENERLRQELTECNKAKGRYRSRVNRSNRDKEKSGGMGFYSGALIGAMVGSVVSGRELSTTILKF